MGAASVADQSADFLNIDARSNAIDSVITAASLLRRNDSFKWKWIAIAVHHALYSFSIAALESGNYEHVLSSGGKRKEDEGCFSKRGRELRWSKSRRVRFERSPAYRIVWEETVDNPPISFDVRRAHLPNAKGKLIDFWTALARIQDERSLVHDVASKPVSISDEDLRAIVWLALRVRNELVHFVPKFWGIEIEGIRCGCMAALKTIEALVFESGTLWMIDDDERSRIKQAIAVLRSGLQP